MFSHRAVNYLGLLLLLSAPLWALEGYFYAFQYTFAALPFLVTALVLERRELGDTRHGLAVLLVALAIPITLWLVHLPIAAAWIGFAESITDRPAFWLADENNEALFVGLIGASWVSTLLVATALRLSGNRWRIGAAILASGLMLFFGFVVHFGTMVIANGRGMQSGLLTIWILVLGLLWQTPRFGSLDKVASTGQEGA